MRRNAAAIPVDVDSFPIGGALCCCACDRGHTVRNGGRKISSGQLLHTVHLLLLSMYARKLLRMKEQLVAEDPLIKTYGK